MWSDGSFCTRISPLVSLALSQRRRDLKCWSAVLNKLTCYPSKLYIGCFKPCNYANMFHSIDKIFLACCVSGIGGAFSTIHVHIINDGDSRNCVPWISVGLDEGTHLSKVSMLLTTRWNEMKSLSLGVRWNSSHTTNMHLARIPIFIFWAGILSLNSFRQRFLVCLRNGWINVSLVSFTLNFVGSTGVSRFVFQFFLIISFSSEYVSNLVQ